MNDRIVSALSRFHRNRRAILKEQGRDTSKIHEVLTTTGDCDAVMEGVDATAEELIAMSDLRQRSARITGARNARWALSGLATEMTMHETNGLLSNMASAIYYLKSKFPDEKLVDRLEVEASTIARNIQFLSRFKVAGHRSRGSTKTVVETLKNEFISLISRKSMTLQVEDRFLGSPFTADRNLIDAVFLNLVRNGIYWGSSEGKLPIVKLDTETITFPAKDPEGEEEWDRLPTIVELLSVEDNGPGVPDDQYEAIFEPGFSNRRSSGIGLHLCRANLEANGYTVVLDEKRSSLGGARFIIGPKSYLNPTSRPEPARMHELAAAALTMCELLEAGHTNELVGFSDVYGEIQCEVLRIRLEGHQDDCEQALLALDDRLREGFSHRDSALQTPAM